MPLNLSERIAPYLQDLPVGSVAHAVNDALDRSSRLILTAPPGAGKSTLIPLTLLQSLDKGRIVMLEPRRLAARQVALRMAQMLGEPVGKTVGYRVRFDTQISAETRIEVVTEGILTRMLTADSTAEGIAAILFDEYHERSLTTDTALALSLETQRLIRPDLRLVIMSATIDADALSRTFEAPVIESSGRMFPVEIIHTEQADLHNPAPQTAAVVREALRTQKGDILVFLPGRADILRCRDLLEGTTEEHILICPLYGTLNPQKQQQALAPAPDGCRKVILATPVAETSLTVEGVTTVIDSGLCKLLKYDANHTLERLETVRITLDMARQRSGRAGRLGPGVCYRMWTKATEMNMGDCRVPEVLQADLTATLLAVKAWGERDIYALPWITPPPVSSVERAEYQLTLTRAIDACGNITPQGQKLAQMPCHPRLAQMLLAARTDREKALAADMAALLEEKDILDEEAGADMDLRVLALRDMRRRGTGRHSHILNSAAQYARLAGVRTSVSDDCRHTGRLLASAFPEWIACRTGQGQYKLANGATTRLDEHDDLGAQRLLAVAAWDKRIFLAASLPASELDDMACWNDRVFWDKKEGKAVARREKRIGQLVLETAPPQGDMRPQIIETICLAAPKEGASMFDFNERVRCLQRRIATASDWHPELALPDVSDTALLHAAAQWLPLFIGQASTSAELKKIDLCEVITGLLNYEQQRVLHDIVPEYITVPTGSRIRLDYRSGTDIPVLSVRLQECFGMMETPLVDQGKRPVLMELLSPGYKPVQLTQDLHNFWLETYYDVRKDLRRRYPKHHWPDHPETAQPVRGVRRKPKE